MFHKAAYARSGGMYNDLFIANFRANLPIKMENRLGFDRIMAMSLWSYFFGPPCLFENYKETENRLIIKLSPTNDP